MRDICWAVQDVPNAPIIADMPGLLQSDCNYLKVRMCFGAGMLLSWASL